MKSRLIITLVFVAFFALVGVIAMLRLEARQQARATATEPEPVIVRLASLEATPYALTETLYGVIEARAAVELRFTISGRIDLLGAGATPENPATIDEGVRVNRGDALAVIDPARYRAEVDAALAELERAEAGLARTNAQIEEARALEADFIAELERTRDAFDRGAGTERDVDRARRAADAATARVRTSQAQREADVAQVRAAEANLMASRARLEDATLRAPFDGVIARLPVEAGQSVSPSDPVALIIDDRTVRLRAGVVERKAPLIREGQRARVAVRALEGQASIVTPGAPGTIEGVVTLVSPSADPATGLFDIEITIENDPESDGSGRGWLRPGMIGRAEVVLAEEPLVLIPEESALDLDGALYVYIARRSSDGSLVANLTRIRPVASDDRYFLLRSPPEGEGLVIEGQTLLSDGAPIRPVEDATARRD